MSKFLSFSELLILHAKAKTQEHHNDNNKQQMMTQAFAFALINLNIGNFPYCLLILVSSWLEAIALVLVGSARFCEILKYVLVELCIHISTIRFISTIQTKTIFILTYIFLNKIIWCIWMRKRCKLRRYNSETRTITNAKYVYIL